MRPGNEGALVSDMMSTLIKNVLIIASNVMG